MRVCLQTIYFINLIKCVSYSSEFPLTCMFSDQEEPVFWQNGNVHAALMDQGGGGGGGGQPAYSAC